VGSFKAFLGVGIVRAMVGWYGSLEVMFNKAGGKRVSEEKQR
jgi:hypothetical protein